MAFGAVVELSSLDGRNGLRIDGEASGDASGRSVSSAGDVNGDGFDDLLVGAPGADPNGDGSGAAYVVFGRAGGFTAAVELSSLDGSDGFQISGEAIDGSYGGVMVSSAGDVNGDGFDDIIFGAPDVETSNETYGASYVVFGRAGGFRAEVQLSGLNGRNGFRLNGEWDGGYSSSESVSSAGDVNGDGFDDLVIGSPSAVLSVIGGGFTYTGVSHVVFGRAGGFGAEFELSGLNGRNGFQINAEYDSYNSLGASVSDAGDVNGDGFDDLVVVDPGTGAYVVFGQAGRFAAELDVPSLNGRNGFQITGGDEASSAGDVNGDGFDDLIIAANAYNAPGASYVVFGRAGGFAAELDPTALNGSDGFRISGKGRHVSVSSAGDVNGDGLDDLIIGAAGASGGNGSSYVVFGKAGGFGANLNLSGLDGRNGFRIDGGGSVSSAGDVNGDGFDDVLVGASGADPNGADSGASYVVFGQATGGPLRLTGSAAGNSLSGGASGDTLSGEGGDDRLFGNGGGDLLLGGAGTDRAQGGSGNDQLFGGFGADQLAGGRGADTLVGGFGADTLSGGFGADVFEFGAPSQSPPGESDLVLGFARGQDRLDLSRIDADRDAGGDQAFAFRGTRGFTGAGGEVRVATANGDTLVLADTDGDRQADLRIVLDGTIALTATDFIL